MLTPNAWNMPLSDMYTRIGTCNSYKRSLISKPYLEDDTYHYIVEMIYKLLKYACILPILHPIGPQEARKEEINPLLMGMYG